MTKGPKIRLAFYGDDFTGSTDALESIARANLRTILFLEVPTEEQLKTFSGFEAVGIAGMTRSMPPAEMEATLQLAFEALKKLAPKHVHYKVCSTFDSSPEIGNIGTAIRVGQAVFEREFVPVLVAAPNLGRYSAFGNLYARMGIGSQGAIYRLDRHPSMSRHPITPADESDLRMHLARQIDCKMGLIDLTDLARSEEKIIEKLDVLLSESHEVVFFDALYEEQMAVVGSVIDSKAQDKPLFSLGSSGVGKALCDHWTRQGLLSERTEWEPVGETGPVLVLSGSCSPVTAEQIDWAVKHGFAEVAVVTDALKDESQFVVRYAEQIRVALLVGRSVIVHTCKGPEDPRMEDTKAFFASLELDDMEMRKETARRFGAILGKAARKALERRPVKRLVIAGGDTSGYVARELGIEAVEMIAPVYAGAPLCRAYAKGSPVDGIEVNLKGGQVGDEQYFEVLRRGRFNEGHDLK